MNAITKITAEEKVDQETKVTTTDGYPFWIISDRGSVSINTSKLIKFLSLSGFGNHQTMEGRLQNKTLFRNDKGVLQIHNPDSVKNWLISFLESDVEVTLETKELVQDKIVKITPSSLHNYLQSLPVYSEQEFTDTIKLDVFRDDKNNCYIPFKNGVVHISATDIKLVPRETLIEKGNIWESSILPHKIDLLDKYMMTKDNVFKDFVTYALKKDIEPLVENNEVNLGTDTSRFKESLESFETGLGYLIHSYNPPDEQKLVVFVDVDSSPDRREGRNGKSVCMETIQYYRNTTFVDGGGFRKTKNDSSRFNFSNVKIDTGFIFINDINSDFDLTQMFSFITDDLTIEGKGTNKIIIPKTKKPKMGITTNYVITGVGGSFEGRQHIVEFGNFWNKCHSKKIKPKDVVGKLIGDDFNEQDWISYYNYGFSCIQKYLRKGLTKTNLSNYLRKNLITVIEGISGTGEILDWMEEWVSTTRVGHNYHVDGIEVDDLYRSFIKDNPTLITSWNIKRFLDGFFEYVKEDENLDWNPQNATKGNTRSSRRLRLGGRGDQKEFIKIVSTKD